MPYERAVALKPLRGGWKKRRNGERPTTGVYAPSMCPTLSVTWLVQLGAPTDDQDIIESDVSGSALILTYRTRCTTSRPCGLGSGFHFHTIWLRPGEDGKLIVTDVVW